MLEFKKAKSNIKLTRDVKNSYDFGIIFSFLAQKRKLKIITYNKQIQKILGVNVQDYITISERYKLIEKNGKGREFTVNENNLIFEGEYINGRRNGKGKEYNNYSELEFEGEYLNEKRNGKGKELYYDGKLKFEGEYLNGQRWNGKGYNRNGIIDFQITDGNGKGKEYNNYGELVFEGEYLNGIRNGKGKEYYYDGKLKFDGEYLTGIRNGKGKEYYYDGKLKFDGEYLNDVRWNGKGYNINGIN